MSLKNSLHLSNGCHSKTSDAFLTKVHQSSASHCIDAYYLYLTKLKSTYIYTDIKKQTNIKLFSLICAPFLTWISQQISLAGVMCSYYNKWYSGHLWISNMPSNKFKPRSLRKFGVINVCDDVLIARLYCHLYAKAFAQAANMCTGLQS